MTGKKWRKEKSRGEIEAALTRQIANMRRSCEAFDDGAMEEAERLASSIYIICHDGGRQSSLLNQLGLKAGLKFTDTDSSQGVEPGVVVFGPPLLGIRNDGIGPIQFCTSGIPHNSTKKPFSKWWDGIVYSNISGKELSRRNLIFFLRSQDGGAHVDGHLRDEAYYRFVTYGDHVSTNSTGTLSMNGFSQNIDSSSVHWLTTRQIAWELDDTLKSIGL